MPQPATSAAPCFLSSAVGCRELKAAAAALASPQNRAQAEIDNTPSRPWVTRKKVPSMASATAASSRGPGRLLPTSAIQTATIAGEVNCNTVAVAVLEAL